MFFQCFDPIKELKKLFCSTKIDPLKKLKILYPRRVAAQGALNRRARGETGCESPAILNYVVSVIDSLDKAIDGCYSKLTDDEKACFEFSEFSRQGCKSCQKVLVMGIKAKWGRSTRRDEADPTDDDTASLLKKQGP